MPPASLTRIADDLERFIRSRFHVSPDDPDFGRETNLWEAGYLDSLSVVEVIEFLQRRLGAPIPRELLFEPDFVRINGIARLTVGMMKGHVGKRR